jgi:hypothetical protein
LYKDILNKIHNITNKTDIKDSSALANIITKRLVIYRFGEMQMWWNSDIFTNEGLLYMKSMFPNSYHINMMLTAMRTARKIERTYLDSKGNNISFFSLTDELEDNIEETLSLLCDMNDKDMKNIIIDLICIDTPSQLDEIFDGIDEKKPEKIEPPIICYGNIKYDLLFYNNQLNFKELNDILQPLLIGYKNSEQKSLNIGYYNII